MIKNAVHKLDKAALEKVGQTFSTLKEFVNSPEYIEKDGTPIRIMTPFLESFCNLIAMWKSSGLAEDFPNAFDEFEHYIMEATAPLESPDAFSQEDALDVIQDVEIKLSGLILMFGAPKSGMSIIEWDNGLYQLYKNNPDKLHPKIEIEE